MRRVLVIVGVAVGLACPSGAGASTIVFDGTFSHGLVDSSVHFKLTNGGTEVRDWTWRHLPVQCREGSDANSGSYNFPVNVHNHQDFRISDVVDPREGFTTKVSGTLSNHNHRATGNFSMFGPEDGPPRHTRCHGTRTWHATGVKVGDLTYKRRIFTVPGQQSTIEAANCPDDHENVAGGGVELEGDPLILDAQGLLIGSSSPIFAALDPDSWSASANNDGMPEATMFVTAICSNAPLEHAKTDVPVAAHDTATAMVPCPSGTQVVGGGVADATTTGVNTDIRVASSRPTDLRDPGPTHHDGWLGAVVNNAAVSGAMKVTAICSAGNSFEYAHSSPRTIPPHDGVFAHANCPHDTRVSGGGAEVAGPAGGLSTSAPFDGGDPNALTDDGWNVEATNSAAQPHDMQVFAICEN